MNKKLPVYTVILITAAACILTFILSNLLYLPKLALYATGNGKYSKLNQMEQIVEQNFIGEVDQNKIIDGILLGYVYGLEDKYSNYFSAEDYKKFTQDNSDKFVGIGITVIPVEGSGVLKITDIYKESPAEESGLTKGDLIVKIEDKNAAEMTYEEAVFTMQGEAGTTVHFSILRGDAEIPFSIERKSFKTYSVNYEILDNQIGYIKITQFKADSTLDEFTEAYNLMHENNVKGIIFDVRGNPGGDLTAICSILDILLPKGPIIRIEDKQGNFEQIDSDEKSLDLPCAVLINENTYSAAELFCSAIKDYKLGKLVGKNTYGKGTMQYVIPFGDGSAVSLSSRMYYPPFSDNYEGVGVSPDIDIANSNENDDQLSAAMKLFN